MSNEKGVRRLLEREGFIDVMSDVDLSYGGTFARDNGDYFDIIEIVDLDSASGAEGQILVSAKTVSFDYLSPSDHKSVQSCCDTKSYLPDIVRRAGKAIARLVYAVDIASYGKYDPAGNCASWFVAVLDREAFNDSREKWGNRVNGWGWAAVTRAIENAIACHDNGYYLPHDILD